jgi:hypothetical protein
VMEHYIIRTLYLYITSLDYPVADLKDIDILNSKHKYMGSSERKFSRGKNTYLRTNQYNMVPRRFSEFRFLFGSLSLLY